MKKFLLGVTLSLMGVVFGSAQEQTALPDWTGKDPYIENGIIYSVGYAKFSSLRMSLDTAQHRAIANMLSLSDLPSIPADAKNIRELESNINGKKVKAVISGVTVLDRFITDEQGAYVLISSTGVEITDQG
jgi:hypothetical protein